MGALLSWPVIGLLLQTAVNVINAVTGIGTQTLQCAGEIGNAAVTNGLTAIGLG